MNIVYYDEFGYKVVVEEDSKLSGGEGKVLDVIEYENPLYSKNKLVLKVFNNKTNLIEKKKKLEDMMELNKNRQFLYNKIKFFVTFPISLVFDENKRFIGYIMNKVLNAISLDKFSRIDLSGRKENIIWNVNNALKAATTLCYIAEVLHSMGYIIADFNDLNILVDEKNISHFIDADSMIFNDYKCNVGISGFLSKEIKDSRGDKNFTVDSDNFALAVHIYKLLTGSFPYSYIEDSTNDRSYNIKNDCYPLLYPDKYNPPLYSIDLNSIPKKLKILFIDAFLHERNRPKPEEWRRQLLSFKEKTKVCSNDGYHEYFAYLKKCPYCSVYEKIENIGKEKKSLFQRIKNKIIH